MSKRLVVYLPGADEGFLSALQAELLGNVEVIREPGRDYEILVRGVVTDQDLGASKKLRAVIIPYAGVPKRTRELLAGHPSISLHNLHHNAAATAETAVALLLAAAKRIVPIDRALRNHDWRPRYDTEQRDPLLAGKLAVILGFGQIGLHVANACFGLRMQVQAIRRSAPENAWVHNVDALGDLLPKARALVVCLPLTEETEGIVGKSELALLPDGAIVVNVGRGPLIDEEALYDELRGGRLWAGLDVWYRYPEDEDSRGDTAPSRFPFHELDNVVMSPHRAGHCAETEGHRARELALALNSAALGDEIPSRVDPERGY